jgi:hypothetical protein
MPEPIRRVFFFALLYCIQTAAFAQNGADLGGPVSTTINIQFLDNNAIFRPRADAAAALETARDAALITIRGRTSMDRFSAKDEALAMARATAARTYLISRGVSPLKIMLNYSSASDFVADNSTQEGRLQNQRVEIEFVHISATLVNPTSASQIESIPADKDARAVQKTTWEILESDGTLQNTFERWSKAANWQVRWESVPEIKNMGYTKLPDKYFLEAAEYVLSQAKAAAKDAGIELAITAYPNRFLVISKEVSK